MRAIKLCSAVLLLLCNAPAGALESDMEQPITIDANNATYDDATTTSTYNGNVIAVQGSMKVTSEKLVVYFKDGDADKLLFTGAPAKFKQTPSAGSQDILGEAAVGEYYPKKNTLVLRTNAVVKQANATYASDYIEYDSKSSVVKAGEKSSDGKRVHVTLQPKPKAQ